MKKLLTLTFVLGLFLCVNAENKNEEPVNNNNSNCITRTFDAYDDGEKIASLTLTSGCYFTLVDIENRESTKGTYELSGELQPGRSERLYLYVNGEYIGSCPIMWPMQGRLTVIINGYSFESTW